MMEEEEEEGDRKERRVLICKGLATLMSLVWREKHKKNRQLASNLYFTTERKVKAKIVIFSNLV